MNVTTKPKGFKICYALRKMGSGNETRLDNKPWKKCWVWEVSLVVYACGKRDPNSEKKSISRYLANAEACWEPS